MFQVPVPSPLSNRQQFISASGPAFLHYCSNDLPARPPARPGKAQRSSSDSATRYVGLHLRLVSYKKLVFRIDLCVIGRGLKQRSDVKSAPGVGVGFSAVEDLTEDRYGYVKIPPGEADKALQLRTPGDGRGAVIWWNDTGLKPTGVQELWFSFKPPETYSFSVEVVGEDAAGEEQTIAYLAHNRAGSARSFYARTTQPCTSTTSPGFRNRLPYCFSPPAVCACDESDASGLAERSGVVKPPTWQTSKGHLRAAFAFSPSHGARFFALAGRHWVAMIDGVEMRRSYIRVRRNLGGSGD